MDDFFLNGAVFGSGPPESVRRDAAGVPVAWRLLKAGKLSLVKNGVADALDITPERLGQAIEYFRSKGEKIPIDSGHYLSVLADHHKISENEVERLIPDGVAAMGYGTLALSADGSELWIDGIQWKDPAYRLLKDGIYKYFSPMLRGLKEGPFRVTCVALENEPAINNLDELAAQAADDINPIRLAARGRIEEKKKGNPMDPTLLKALQKLIPGCDVLALAAEDPAKSKPEQNKIACAVEDTAVMLNNLRQALQLPAEADVKTILAAVQGVLAKARTADTAQQENLAMKASIEKTEKARLIAEGKQTGQITDAMLAWADTQDSKALSAYLQQAPKHVPTGQLSKPARKADDGDALALTAEEKTICRMAHVSEENYLKEKKGGSK